MRFGTALAAIAVAAAAMRLVFTLEFANPKAKAADPLLYLAVAENLADGAGYAYGRVGSTMLYANHPPEPFGHFPPVFPCVLAALDVFGLRSPREQRVALAIVSTAGVVLMGFLGRRLGRVPVGLAAAAIAAFHPLWVQPAGIGMSESVFLVVLPALLLSAVRFLDHPTTLRAVVLGLAIGLTTLTRSESIALLVVLGVPAVMLAVTAWRTRIALAVAMFAGCLIFVGPWVLRNFLQFGGLALSTQQGAAFGVTNCPETYYGPAIGGFDPDCYSRYIIVAYMGSLRDEGTPRNPLRLSHELQRMGIAYMKANRDQLPRVVLARIFRGWGLFATADQLRYDVTFEGRDPTFQRAGQYLHWLLLPLAVAGAALLPRGSWRRWSVVLAGPLLFTFTSAVIYGSVRLRTMAEPSIALLAAVSLVRAGARLRACPRRYDPRAKDRSAKDCHWPTQ
jgi:hypothetical protein